MLFELFNFHILHLGTVKVTDEPDLITNVVRIKVLIMEIVAVFLQ